MEMDRTYVQQLQEIGRELADRHLVAGAAGNISIRSETGEIYVSARGSRLGALREEDVVRLSADGAWAPRREPTSEYLIHTLTHQAFPDVRVVLHTHSAFATAAAVIGEDIPPIVDEMTILIGGGLQVAPYAPPGSRELAQNAVAAMGDRKAVLLSNHGAVIAGVNPEDALKIAELTEHVAQIYLLAKTAGKVRAIPEAAYEKQRAMYLKKRGVLPHGQVDKP